MNTGVQTAGDLAVNQAMSNVPVMNRIGKHASSGTVDKSAKEFEGMFMAQMLKPMFDTVSVDPLFGGGHGEEVMRDFLVQEYGKAMAKTTNFGISDAVRAEMIRAQETKHPGASASASGSVSAL